MVAAAHRIKVLAMLAIAASLVTLAAAPHAQAARGMELALQDDAVLLQRVYYDRDTALRQIEALGVTRLRVNLYWTRVLPRWQQRARKRPPVLLYDWSSYDNLIAAAAAHGMRVQLTIGGPTPAFATGNRRVGVHNPNPRQYADFVRTAAAHFRGRVDRYSIWNEPNHVGWLTPHRRAPSIYRKLYVEGYRAIKSVDPGAQVLIGETSPYYRKGAAMAPIKFLRGAACVDSRWRRHCRNGLHADGYAHHPYEFVHGPRYRYPGRDNATIGTLGNLTRALDRLKRSGALRPARGKRIDLFLTEYGYFASGHRAISERKRVKYMRQSYAVAFLHPRVRQLLQYMLVSPPRGRDDFDTALLGRGGRLTPVYHALMKRGR
jgi:hypothetical protein